MNLLFAPLVLTTLATPTPIATPQVARVVISPNDTNRSLGFEWDGMNVDGDAHDVPVLRAVIRYTNPLLAASTVEVIIDFPSEIDSSGGTTKIPMRDALRGVPKGDWDAQIALEDVAFQRGPFSAVTDKTRFTVSINPPSAPKNVGVVAN